jgi:hypothetical protein
LGVLLKDYHLIVKKRCACDNHLEKYAGECIVPGAATNARQVKERGLHKVQSLYLLLGVLIRKTHCVKTLCT